MAQQPTPLELELLCHALDNECRPFIVGAGQNPRAQQSNFYSKALAAYVLLHDAGASPEEATKASIDGGQDHGIDSVYIAVDETLWLIQSKYVASGSGEPALGDVGKFRDGVADLIQGKFERFNQMLQAKQADIERAFNQEHCRVRAVLAYTGTALSDDRRAMFSDLERAFNASNPEFVRCYAYGLATLHGIQLDTLALEPIEADIELRDFGHIPTPYKVFYGRLSAKRLAELGHQYSDALIERNIRRFKGSTAVNDGLTATLSDEPHHFFYFNNGVTFLCKTMHERHPRDANRQTGRFTVHGLSIINGAQTVGAIAREEETYYDAHPAEVLATFVCLENAPDDFGDKVTQSRNRQNAVDLEDFAALDERQESWRQTLAIAGIDYLFKHGDGDSPLSDSVFSVREAAPALACCMTGIDWPNFVIAAKSDRKRLFHRPELAKSSDVLGDAYQRLFPDSLTARELWRVVQVSRAVQKTLKDRANGEPEVVVKDILRHGVWIVLHVLFIKTQLRNKEALELTEPERNRISVAVDTIANQLVTSAQSQQWNKQYRSVFENRTNCQTIKNSVMAALTQPL